MFVKSELQIHRARIQWNTTEPTDTTIIWYWQMCACVCLWVIVSMCLCACDSLVVRYRSRHRCTPARSLATKLGNAMKFVMNKLVYIHNFFVLVNGVLCKVEWLKMSYSRCKCWFCCWEVRYSMQLFYYYFFWIFLILIFLHISELWYTLRLGIWLIH